MNADGTLNGGEVALNAGVTFQQGKSNTVALPNGGFVAIWDEYSGVPGDGNDLKVQKYNEAGSPVGTAKTVDLALSTEMKDPEVTSLADGGFVVTWWGGFGVDGDSWGVFAQMFNKSGKPVGGEFQVNTTTASQQWAPDIKGLPDGGFVAVWQSFDQDGSGEAVVGQRFDANGEKIGDEFIVNSSTGAAQWYAGIDVAKDGGFVISWQSHHLGSNQWQIMAQHYEAQSFGTHAGDEMRDTLGVDHMYGLHGNDRMWGLNGSDLMFGGARNDVLRGGKGDDTLLGENGRDSLRGGAGDDVLKGGKGSDKLGSGPINPAPSVHPESP